MKILDKMGLDNWWEFFGIFAPAIFFCCLILAAIYGWVNNIVLLALHHADMVMVVLRIVGIIVWPIGIILGYINM